MERVVDIATDGRHLSLYRGFMLVEEDRQEVGRIALDDIHSVIIQAHGTTWSANLVAALAERGAPIVFCGSNHSPIAITLPLNGHHVQNARFRAQWEASTPLMKQLWRRVVSAKILMQGSLLAARGVDGANALNRPGFAGGRFIKVTRPSLRCRERHSTFVQPRPAVYCL